MKPGLMILCVQSMILDPGGGAIVVAIFVILLFWIRREDFVGVMLSLESWRRRVPFWRRIEVDVVAMIVEVIEEGLREATSFVGSRVGRRNEAGD